MERGAGQMACGQDQMGSGPDHGICGSDCGSEHGSSHRIACGLVPREMIQGFIDTQVTGRGLDGRTEKAYRLDLEHFLSMAGGKKAFWRRRGRRRISVSRCRRGEVF